MGRWSNQVAMEFVDWLAIPPDSHWLEVGCGTGALTRTFLQAARPSSAFACDPSEEFIAYARASLAHPALTFLAAGSDDLPHRDGGFDAIVSGLVFNFLPDPPGAARSMALRLADGGTLAAYVWDYSEGMQFLRFFWDAALSLDPQATPLDEGRRFPICRPEALASLFHEAELHSVEVRPIEIKTVFSDFQEYWGPFLGGTGPGPSYVASLNAEAREALRRSLHARLPNSSNGSIDLLARAWAVRGIAPARAV